MTQLAKDLVIVAAKRTPFGGYGGSLKSLSATDLGVCAAKAAMEDGGVSPEDIDAVVFGNVLQTSKDAIYRPWYPVTACYGLELLPVPFSE